MCIGLHVNCPLFCQGLMELEFSRQTVEKYSDIQFYESPSGRVVYCRRKDRRTDGLSDMAKLYAVLQTIPKTLRIVPALCDFVLRVILTKTAVCNGNIGVLCEVRTTYSYVMQVSFSLINFLRPVTEETWIWYRAATHRFFMQDVTVRQALPCQYYWSVLNIHPYCVNFLTQSDKRSNPGNLQKQNSISDSAAHCSENVFRWL
jgi:hypothetical protein